MRKPRCSGVQFSSSLADEVPKAMSVQHRKCSERLARSVLNVVSRRTKRIPVGEAPEGDIHQQFHRPCPLND